MKRTIGVLAGALSLASVVYLGSQLRAQPQQFNQVPPQGVQMQPAPSASPKIAVINLGQVIRNYVKFKNFEADMNAKKAQYRQQLEQKNNQLLQLQAEAGKLTTDAARREQLDRQARDLQRQAQDMSEDAKATLQKMEFDQLVAAYKDIQDATASYARPRGIDMVLHFNDAIGTDQYLPQFFGRKLANGACYPLYVQPNLDITNEITAMLNAKAGQAPGAVQPASATMPAPQGGQPQPQR